MPRPAAADAKVSMSVPPNHQRECHRLVIAAKVNVSLWLLEHTGGTLMVPGKSELVSATAHDISVTGLGVTLHSSVFARLPIDAGDSIGLVIEYGDERIVCGAVIRHLQGLGDDMYRVGLGFTFDTSNLVERRLSRKVERIVAAMNREALRRRSYYGTPEATQVTNPSTPKAS